MFGGSASPRLFSSAGNVLMASRKTFYEAADRLHNDIVQMSPIFGMLRDYCEWRLRRQAMGDTVGRIAANK